MRTYGAPFRRVFRSHRGGDVLRLMTSGALLLPALLGLSISTVVQPLEPADMPTTPSAASVLTQHLAPVAIGMQSSVAATVPWITQYRQIANVSATAEPPLWSPDEVIELDIETLMSGENGDDDSAGTPSTVFSNYYL